MTDETPRYKLDILDVRVVREADAPEVVTISAPDEVAALARSVIPDDDREHMGIFLLNTKNVVVAYHEISVGSLSAAVVHPREVFKVAILHGAAGLVLVHNHPSGDVNPSKEDIAITQRLAEGAALLGLRLLDHIIVAHANPSAYHSMVAAGHLKPQKATHRVRGVRDRWWHLDDEETIQWLT